MNRSASLDFWDDQNDVYAVRLRRGGRLVATLSRATANVNLTLWKPGTRRVNERRSLANVAAQSVNVGRAKVVRFGLQSRINRAGIYYLAGFDRRPEHDGVHPAHRPPLSVRRQLVVGHFADLPRRVADDDGPRRHVLRDDGAGADERLLTDLDPR